MVEVIDHGLGWQPYFPPLVGLLGSVIVAAAAYYGTRRSSRSTREIEAEKWRTDKLLQICYDVSTASRRLDLHFSPTTVEPLDRKGFDRSISVLREETRNLGSLADSLTILGAAKLAEACRSIRARAYDIQGSAQKYKQLLTSSSRDADALREQLKKLDAKRKAIDDERRRFVGAARIELSSNA